MKTFRVSLFLKGRSTVAAGDFIRKAESHAHLHELVLKDMHEKTWNLIAPDDGKESLLVRISEIEAIRADLLE